MNGQVKRKTPEKSAAATLTVQNGRLDPKEKATAVPTERIRARAYELYQSRAGNGGIGDELSDWLQAELECGQEDAVTSEATQGRLGPRELPTKAANPARGEALLRTGTGQ